jgi:hypothetical protein
MLQERSTPFVPRLRFHAFMCIAVDLHYEPRRLAYEVAEIDAQSLLAAEFETVKRGAA